MDQIKQADKQNNVTPNAIKCLLRQLIVEKSFVKLILKKANYYNKLHM